MPEIPKFILDRVRANAGLFTGDEVAEWPSELLEELVAAGVFVPEQPAKSVSCNSCGDDHIETVQYIESPTGTGLRPYIPCPQLGRVFVPAERLRRWSIDSNMMTTEPTTNNVDPTDVSNQVSHALAVARANLIAALRQADDLYQRTLRFPNPRPVIDAIERFVHELELASSAMALGIATAKFPCGRTLCCR